MGLVTCLLIIHSREHVQVHCKCETEDLIYDRFLPQSGNLSHEMRSVPFAFTNNAEVTSTKPIALVKRFGDKLADNTQQGARSGTLQMRN